MSETYRRRQGPVDIEVVEVGKNLVDYGKGNENADKDYFRNLKDHSDPKESSAAAPNRNKGNEKGQKP